MKRTHVGLHWGQWERAHLSFCLWRVSPPLPAPPPWTAQNSGGHHCPWEASHLTQGLRLREGGSFSGEGSSCEARIRARVS